jgi:hypothetical protein
MLDTFQGYPDGYDPTAGVIRDPAGNLYGTTSSGGADSVGNLWHHLRRSMFNYGTVFKLDAKGHQAILYKFRSDPDGPAPCASGLTGA